MGNMENRPETRTAGVMPGEEGRQRGRPPWGGGLTEAAPAASDSALGPMRRHSGRTLCSETPSQSPAAWTCESAPGGSRRGTRGCWASRG